MNKYSIHRLVQDFYSLHSDFVYLLGFLYAKGKIIPCFSCIRRTERV